jgi:formylglycine-generating enzyme required for sulfatase activity
MASPIHHADLSLSEFHEPRVVRIPEGWFLMGSEAGQDNERPVHRVAKLV